MDGLRLGRSRDLDLSLAELPVSTQVKRAKSPKIKRLTSTLLDLQEVRIIKLELLNRSLRQCLA